LRGPASATSPNLLFLATFLLLKLRQLGLFPDLRWEKEVRWERTAVKEHRSRVKVGG
jgi:hypothetical protein